MSINGDTSFWNQLEDIWPEVKSTEVTNSTLSWKATTDSEKIANITIQNLYSILSNSKENISDLIETDQGILILPKAFYYKNVSLSIIAITSDKYSHNSLLSIINNSTRESIVICLSYDPSLAFEKIEKNETNYDLNFICFYPLDIHAIANSYCNICDLIEFKLYRKLIQYKGYSDTQYHKALWDEFLNNRNSDKNFIEKLEGVLESYGDDFRNMINHPQDSSILSAIDNNRNCLLVGQSSSGKSILALQIGHSKILKGESVGYINLSTIHKYSKEFFELLFTDKKEKYDLLIIDDLQSNPTLSKYLLSIASAITQTTSFNKPRILAVSWIEYSKDAVKYLNDCRPFSITPLQIKNKILNNARGILNEDVLNEISNFYKDDILLISLALRHSAEENRLVKPIEIAERIWTSKWNINNLPSSSIKKIVLIIGSLGRYDISTSSSFVKAEGQIEEEDLTVLVNAGLLRKKLNEYSLGHRSLCTLLTDYLSSIDGWNEFKKPSAPHNGQSIVLDYIRSLGSTLAVDFLKGLHAKVGFKEGSLLNKRAVLLVEIWSAFNAIVERLQHQQMNDPTWGNIPSSAMFAIETFSRIGKSNLSEQSIKFLRSKWKIENSRIEVLTNEFATSSDFEKIAERMKAEDNRSPESFPKYGKAEEIQIDLFHRTWILGLILGVESYAKREKKDIEILIKLVEGEQLPSGAFYPERVPWCTARVLLGLAACGRGMENSEAVKKAVNWLINEASVNGIWKSGTGNWNSTLETTSMVLLALNAVGFDCSDHKLSKAINYLTDRKNEWGRMGEELDGALAIHAFLAIGEDWEQVAFETQKLSQWAKSEALWQGATLNAKDSLSQSCRVAQIASHLIHIGWSAIKSDIPSFLDALVLHNMIDNSAPSNELEKKTIKSVDLENDLEFDLLNSIHKINLLDYTIVGGYARYNHKIRNSLSNWMQRIKQPLITPTTSRENFLIWAAPGSGKSYFIQQIADSFNPKIEFIELNLAKSQEEFLSGISKIKNKKEPFICLIDEVDSKPEESWPYESFFSHLDINIAHDRNAVFILIGSTANGLRSMVEQMALRHKGKDLLDRIPDGNRFEIAPMDSGDQIIIILTQLMSAFASEGSTVSEVEKFALYYILKNKGFSSPRQLRELAVSAANRVIKGDKRVLYEDLFHRGDKTPLTFWADNQKVQEALSEVFIKIE